MGSFCTKCGRPLQDGEVCNCTQQQYQQQYAQQPQYDQQQYGQQQYQYQQQYNQQQQYAPQQQYQQQYNGAPNNAAGNFFNGFGQFFKSTGSFLKDPIGTLKELYYQNNLNMGLYMFISATVMVFLYLLIVCLKISAMISKYTGYSDFPTGQILFGGLILYIVYYFASTGILWGLTRTFTHQDIRFGHATILNGGGQWWLAMFIAVASVFGLISIPAGAFILTIGGTFVNLFTIISYCEIVDMNSSKKFYCYLLYTICLAVVLVIMMMLFGNLFGELLSYLYDL